jgi:nucleoside-diphosphate-sugar epimerase
MMRVVIAGGHGKIALILERLLGQRGDSVAAFIRNPDHAADLQAAGAEALVVDLENASVDEVSAHLEGADAVVFAAGAGGVAERHAKRPSTVTQRFCSRTRPKQRKSAAT